MHSSVPTTSSLCLKYIDSTFSLICLTGVTFLFLYKTFKLFSPPMKIKLSDTNSNFAGNLVISYLSLSSLSNLVPLSL